MLTDPIADCLTRIRNASSALLPDVAFPHSRVKEGIARILKSEGYIQDFQVEGDKKKSIRVRLKYQGRKGVIVGLKRVSRPGIRKYVGSQEVPRVLGGLGTAILSTPRGLMSGNDARKNNVGGEVLCFVW